MRFDPKRASLLLCFVLLTGCIRLVPDSGRDPRDPALPPAPPPTGVSETPDITRPALPEPTSALAAGVREGPYVSGLGYTQADAEAALNAFIASCPRLLNSEDRSGLTQPSNWEQACAAAPRNRGTADTFFAAYFETAIVGSGEAFATGYFEPEILGSRTRRPGYDVPVYREPPDLKRAWPNDVPESERSGRPPLGRTDATGNHVPYYERAEIEAGALAGRGLEIAWAADPIEFFFLQIQGSGLLRLPDGSLMRIGYAGQNGREYVGIGRVMRDRGLIGDGPGQYPGSMQGIIQYLRDNPQEGVDLMQLNKSWIFFRELNTDGPLGSLGVPVRRESSVAVDPRFVPYGAPVWLDLDRAEADGLWVAQDTGGAIKGANRFDTFWGNGAQAREIAGGMSGRGQALILLPRGTVRRLNASP